MRVFHCYVTRAAIIVPPQPLRQYPLRTGATTLRYAPAGGRATTHADAETLHCLQRPGIATRDNTRR